MWCSAGFFCAFPITYEHCIWNSVGHHIEFRISNCRLARDVDKCWRRRQLEILVVIKRKEFSAVFSTLVQSYDVTRNGFFHETHIIENIPGARLCKWNAPRSPSISLSLVRGWRYGYSGASCQRVFSDAMHECLAGVHGWRWFVSGAEHSYSATRFSVQLRLKFPFDWSYIPNWLYSTTESEKLETIGIKITFKLRYQTQGVSTRLASGKKLDNDSGAGMPRPPWSINARFGSTRDVPPTTIPCWYFNHLSQSLPIIPIAG